MKENMFCILFISISLSLPILLVATVYNIDPVNGPLRSFRELSRVSYCLQPGDEVIVHAGTYRETVLLCGHGREDAPITVRAADDASGKVFVKGSDIVSNWTFVKHSSECDIYNTTVSYDILPNVQVPVWGKPLSPYALLSDMLFVNGESYLQIVEKSSLVVAKSFWVAPIDTSAVSSDREMTICVPTGTVVSTSTVEVAVRQRGFFIEWTYYPTLTSDWITVSGIHVSQVATTNNGDYSRTHGSGLMVRTGSNHKFINCSSQYNNWDGFDFYGVNVTLINVVSSHNGNVGLAPGGPGAVIRDCDVSYNSWRYGNGDNSGGVKMCGGGDGQHSASFIRCSFIGNQGPGIWFDTVGGGHLIDQCYFEANQDIGILFEAISPTFGSSTVRNSIFAWHPGADSGQDYVVTGNGIHIYNAADIYIYHNTFYNNYHAGVVLMGGDDRNGGITQRINIFNNIFVANESISEAGSVFVPHNSVGVYMWTWGISLGKNRTHFIDHNVYFKTPGSSSSIMVVQFDSFYSLVDLPQLQSKTHNLFDSHSVQKDPLFLQQRSPFPIADNSPAVSLGLVRLASDLTWDYLQRSRGHYAQDAGATLSTLTSNSPFQYVPSARPSSLPTSSLSPSIKSSSVPSSARPVTLSPTLKPTIRPSSRVPTTTPSKRPTRNPTTLPSKVNPTLKPTSSVPSTSPQLLRIRKEY